MENLTSTIEWQALQAHQQIIASSHMRNWFAQDPERFAKFSTQAADIFLDYSKNLITDETLSLLCKLAEKAELSKRIEALFTGDIVNSTENRAALHTALRNLSTEAAIFNQDILPSIEANLARMAKFCDAIHSKEWRGFSNKPITDVVNLGIGGSDLGPAMVTEALAPFATSELNCHFVSNVDGSHISNTLKNLNPETTLFILSSKSFTTLETLTNANSAKHWLIQAAGSETAIKPHFLAITHEVKKAQAYGIPLAQILTINEWIGGRYSLWSSIGLPIALAIGMGNFKELLAGASAMDTHFFNAPFTYNLPTILGLLGIWYSNFFACQTHAIFPYDQHLKRLPAYIQQLDMESNGKQTTHQGLPVNYSTGPIIWGEVGCNGQHAFHQLLHQGTHLIPSDFIIALQSHHPLPNHHAILFANCLSQSQALMRGKTLAEATQELLASGYSEADAHRLAPHLTMPGNRPSNTLIIPRLTPRTLGALLALYEHKTFVQGSIWNINSFDQWGVELGKQLAKKILATLQTGQSDPEQDASTQGLIQLFCKSCS